MQSLYAKGYIPSKHITLKQRRINVDATSSKSHRLCFDVVLAFCVYWDKDMNSGTTIPWRH